MTDITQKKPIDIEEVGLLDDEQFENLTEEEQASYVEQVFSNQWWRLNRLYQIADEEGRVVTFKPRPQQTRLLTLWWCVIVLKARQLGFSTAIVVYFLDSVLFNNDLHAGIVAQDLGAAQTLFENKARFAYSKLPRWLQSRIPTVSNNQEKMAFENGSSISIDTSYRSKTLQLLHVSEAGKISLSEGDSRELVSGTFAALSSSDCRIFIESTAEGAAGLFYDKYNEAVELEKEGTPLQRRQFKPMFVPWFTDTKYKADKPDSLLIPERITKYLNEVESVAGVTLSESQRYWYYLKDIEVGSEIIKQEFPSTDLEAFLTSGRLVFGASELASQRANLKDPVAIFKYHQKSDSLSYVEDVGIEGQKDSSVKISEDMVLIFEEPYSPKKYGYKRWSAALDDDPNFNWYFIGVDVSMGKQVTTGKKSDRSSIDVIDKHGNQVAHFAGRIHPRELANLAAKLGRIYNNAFIGVERNNQGLTTVTRLAEIYPMSRIYHEHTLDRADTPEKEQLGWYTSEKSKPLLIDSIREAIRHRDSGIRWYGTLKECQTYVYDEKGAMNAMAGCFDDRVISYGIALKMLVLGTKPFYSRNSDSDII